MRTGLNELTSFARKILEPMRYLLFVLVLLLVTGCVARTLGAAGANAEKDADVDYYLKANEVEPRIRKAMRDRTIVKGMTPPQVRLTMGAKTYFAPYPDNVKKTGNGEVWV